MMAFQSRLCFYATLFIHQTARILAMTRTDLRLTIHLLHRDDRDSRTSIFMDNSLGLRRRTQTVSGDPNLYDRHETHSPRSPNYLQINGNRGDLSPRKKHLR